MYLSTLVPAGNGVLASIVGDTLHLRPDLRGNREYWFYWHVAICGAAGRTLTLCFDGQPAFGPRGPALSLDQGQSWHWLGPCPIDRCTLTVPADCDDLRVSMTIPYTGTEWKRFLHSLPSLQEQELCRSPANRPVPLLRFGATPEAASAQIVLTARHHCCESIASFVLEGAVTRLLQSPAMHDVSVVVCPFMDTDGVEQGDQGKFRAPHDHNRDYTTGRYPETTALRALMESPGRAKLPTYSVDLHGPWLRGEWNEHIYIVGNGQPQCAAQQVHFADVLARQGGELLGFRADDVLKHGVAWNTGRADVPDTCGRWFAHRPHCRLSASLEIPYGQAREHEVTPRRARAFGENLAAALTTFID